MIPVKLKMRNFMPYHGDMPPFSFEGIHTACICGDNGNGKSALIDTITWALWGKSRVKSDDDIIHLGEKETEVEFDFTVGGQLYRIIRKHSLPRSSKYSGQSSLDLFIGSDEGFKTISGDTQRLTQQKIISLLNMDYDTFVNSAFLRQGHADEFTKQQPNKRKEVLSSILGLSVYDSLEERARELSRRQQNERIQLENAIREIEQELEGKQELEDALKQAQDGLAALEAQIKEQQTSLNNLRQKKQALESIKQQLAQLEEHISRMEADLKRWNSQTEQRKQRIDKYRTLMDKRSDIEGGYNRFSQAKKLNDEFNQKLQLLNKSKERERQLEKVIDEAQSKLLRQFDVSQSKIGQLEAISQKLPRLKEEKAGLDKEQQQLAQLDAELQAKRQHQNDIQAAIRQLESSRRQLGQEIRDIDEKLNLLHTQDNAKCPLCETEIGHEGLDAIRDNYNKDKSAKSAQLESQGEEMAVNKNELTKIDKDLNELEARLNKNRAALQGKTGVLTHSITEAEEAAGKLKEERQSLSEIESSLSSKDFAAPEQLALKQLQDDIVNLQYDSALHQQASRQVKELENYEQSKRQLDEAERLLAMEQDELGKAEDAVRELDSRLKEDLEQKKSLEAGLIKLPQIETELAQAEKEYTTTAESQKQAQETSGSLKGRLEYLLRQEDKLKQKKDCLGKTATDSKVYLDLAQAFGKRGIQAMLIEMALPEIENEANKLLGRMTDNRMHIKIETQKPTKKGELQETLDIIISDDLGARPYETFSGGEAFRIDFAIRIALSRLLAKRAGAPMPTLIIDEGFGTQDNIGLEKVKEAINSIQDDFDKILVITHIDELKDAFPTRINVIKTATGSTLEAG